MPSSMLFAINNEGRVFGLSTNGTKWREFPYPGIEFKHISAVPHYLWAIGSDRQVYLHVHGLDTAIRVKEEAFENQRWLPIDGFSNRLLPTDRHTFSSEDGLTERRKDKIRVPSMAWKWESDWKIETMLDNEPLDHDGWTYAVDFPATYCSSKKWNSCVRRRKWMRHRKYIAINSWCSIAPLHSDPTQEPFRDVSVGGQNMVGGEQGAIQVWAVTVHGRVMWRKGVSTKCPEGTKWNEIPLPPSTEVKQVSCGPADLVWAVTTSGKALVRLGITPGSPTGESWTEIDPPIEDVRLTEVCVGTKVVWGLTEDNSVWFRKGVGQSDSPLGIGWVHMVRYMACLSLSSSDQVLGIGDQDRNIYIRVGVNDGELTGKRWKVLQSLVQDSRASSSSSISHYSNPSLFNDVGGGAEDFLQETSRSAPTSLDVQTVWHKPIQPSSLPASEGFIEEPALTNSSCKEEIEPRRKLTAWSPVRSVGSVLGLEANPDTDPNADWDGEVFQERESICEPNWNQVATVWSCLTAGALSLDPTHLPNWFSDSGYSSGLETAPWRCKILQDLQAVNITHKAGYETFELAVEKTSCTKSVECRFSLSGNQVFEDCVLELEWISNQSNCVESGSLTILSVEKNVTKHQLSVSEMLCVVPSSEPGSPRLSVHTVSTSEPLVIQFAGDMDFDDWLAQLTSVICGLQGLEGTPTVSSIWATTALGDVFVFDTSSVEKQQLEDDSFCKDLSLKHKTVPWTHVLTNGFMVGSSLTVVCNIPENAYRFSINLECEVDLKIGLHLNPRFDQSVVVRNSKENGVWEKEEREGSFPLKAGTTASVHILCQQDSFKIVVNGTVFTYFEHRIKPELITVASIIGCVELQKVLYKSKKPILDCSEMFWREMGGHMSVVETCSSGVTWGISANNTPWVYTGGWGGFLAGLEKSSQGVYPMSDSYCFYVYENQRWNPLSGFSCRGLPTDRPMWSDSTGRKKRSKETTRLLNMHWQWVSDWNVDFMTPGGVDGEGWQYATDFPASYHSRKTLTDYVRRRRWSRKCKLTTAGPWEEVGNSKIYSISLQQSSAIEVVCVWAVGTNGDALFRKGVSTSNPMGDCWEQVACDQPLQCISCGFGNQVWAVSRKGSAYWRFGITTSNPMGMSWELVDSPKGSVLKKVSVARWSVWSLDTDGNIFIRHDVSPVFPEGSHWQNLQSNETFRDISAGGDAIWAVTSKGTICHRVGVSSENPAGQLWEYGISSNWKIVSCRSFK